MKDFNEQAISDTAWAVAKMSQKDDPLFVALALAAERHIKLCSAQEMSKTARVFVDTGQKDEASSVALAAAAA